MSGSNVGCARRRLKWVAVGGAALIGCAWVMAGCDRPGSGSADGKPQVAAASVQEAGKYLVMVGGCNDCHTPGYMEKGTQVPESEWLTGVPVGWRGPWGTTYASNLRLMVQSFNEEGWVAMLRGRKARPPMPWASVNAMSDADLRAMYTYIKGLGAAGERTPTGIGPTEKPTTPFRDMMPQTPK